MPRPHSTAFIGEVAIADDSIPRRRFLLGASTAVAASLAGYPGLPALYANSIDEYRHKRYLVEPRSIADFA